MPDAHGPSGASDLHSGGLREVGQSGHELRNHLAVASVLHEVGQTLGRAGDLNDGAALGGNKTGDDVLAPGHHAHRGVDGWGQRTSRSPSERTARPGWRAGTAARTARRTGMPASWNAYPWEYLLKDLSYLGCARSARASTGEVGATRTDAVASV